MCGWCRDAIGLQGVSTISAVFSNLSTHLNSTQGEQPLGRTLARYLGRAVRPASEGRTGLPSLLASVPHRTEDIHSPGSTGSKTLRNLRYDLWWGDLGNKMPLSELAMLRFNLSAL